MSESNRDAAQGCRCARLCIGITILCVWHTDSDSAAHGCSQLPPTCSASSTWLWDTKDSVLLTVPCTCSCNRQLACKSQSFTLDALLVLSIMSKPSDPYMWHQTCMLS